MLDEQLAWNINDLDGLNLRQTLIAKLSCVNPSMMLSIRFESDYFNRGWISPT
jgi:hypothetical protein